MTEQQKLHQILEGTVDQVVTGIIGVSADYLAILLYLETEMGAARKGVIKALESEIEALKGLANIERVEAVEVAISEVVEAKDKEIEALKASMGAAELAEVKAANAQLTKELDNARQSAAKRSKSAPKKEATGEARKLEVSEKADFEAAHGVLFVTAEDMTIEALPMLVFSRSDFSLRGNGKVLMRPIDIPGDIPPTTINSIALCDKNGAASLCDLAVPIRVGGGRKAVFPARSLLFNAPMPLEPATIQAD